MVRQTSLKSRGKPSLSQGTEEVTLVITVIIFYGTLTTDNFLKSYGIDKISSTAFLSEGMYSL